MKKKTDLIPATPAIPALAPKATRAEWKAYGENLLAALTAFEQRKGLIQITIGTWIVFGLDKFGQTDTDATIAEIAGHYTRATLYNFAWVARKIPADLHNPAWTFEDYRALAALPDAKAMRRFAKRKEKEALTGGELRAAITQHLAKALPAPTETKTDNPFRALIDQWTRTGEKLKAKGTERAMAQANAFFDCAAQLQEICDANA